MIDDIDSTVHNIFEDYLKYGEVVADKINIIRELEFDKLQEVFKKLDFNNKAVVVMKNMETN